MNLTGILRVQEKVAASKDFTVEEIDFILDAISTAVQSERHLANLINGFEALRKQREDEPLPEATVLMRYLNEPESVTRSCGCIFCDLDIELHEDEQGFHHVIRGSRFNCTAFKP